MKTHISKLILTFLTLLWVWNSHATSVETVTYPDVQVFVTLPTGPDKNDGIIDLIINAGVAPYNIKYAKDDGSGNFNIEHEITADNVGDEDYLLATVGNYKIEIVDAHCANLTLDIVVSMECNCPTPLLNYDDINCSLSWDNQCEEDGSGYTYVLQFKINGVFYSLSTSGTNYSIPQGLNGDYRLIVTKTGCPDIFSDVITTSCASSSCTCNIPVLNYDANNCNISWSLSGCPGYSMTLEYQISTSDWVDVSSTSPFSINDNGNYRLALTKPGCSTQYTTITNVTCYDPNSGCSCTPPTLSIDTTSCSVTWMPPSCPGYNLVLQRLNSSNTWINVGNSSPFSVTENGSHRLVLSKPGCPDEISNTVSVTCYDPNNGCNCPAPSLNLNPASCTLAWSVSSCSGYVAIVQKLNNANVWENVGTTSPHSVTGNGSHRILLSKPGCPDVYSNVVSVTCYNPNSGCNCPAPSLTYNVSECSLSWTPPTCPGYAISLQKLNNSNVWVNIGVSSPYAVNENGSYRLILTKIGCNDIYSNIANVTCVNPNGNCTCPASSLSYNSTACNLTWNPSSCSGYSSTLQKLNAYTGIWSNITTSSPYSIPQNQNGNYRIINSKSGCPDVTSNTVYVSCSCTNLPNITTYVMNGSDPGYYQTIDIGSTDTMSLSQSSPSGCVGDKIFLGILDSEINSNWLVSGQNLQVNNSVASDGYIIFEVQLPADPSVTQGVLTFVSPCGDIYSISINLDCCLSVNFSNTTNNVCDIINIIPNSGIQPFTYEIYGTGTSGTQIQQNNPDIDFSVLEQGEEISLSITIFDANGCSISFMQDFARCSGTCTTDVAGSTICECFVIDGVGFDNASCSIDGYASGCTGPGVAHIFNSNNEEVGTIPTMGGVSDPETVALLNNVINTNGNDTYTFYFECDCGYSNPFTIDVSCLGQKSSSSETLLDNIKFYPNPFSYGIYASIFAEKSTEVNLNVFNNLGQKVIITSFEIIAGENVNYIEAFESLPSGVYTIEITINNVTSFNRVVKAN